MSATLITPPATEPVDIASAKAHLRETGTSQDALIAMYLQAAREHVEATTSARCVEQTWRLKLDAFPCGRITLPGYPLREVTSVQYVDADGVTQEIEVGGLLVDTDARPGWIDLEAGWPDTKDQPAAVTIEYSVGYATSADLSTVPASLKNAILLLAGDLFENRQRQQKDALVENPAVSDLLWPFRLLAP